MSDELLSIRPADYNAATLAKLNELEAGLRDKALARAVRASAKPLQTIMKATAPDDPRTPGASLALATNTVQLRNNQKIRIGKGRETRAVVADSVKSVAVGPNVNRKKIAGFRFDLRPLQTLALWLEHGTKPHLIGKRRIRMNIGGRMITGPIHHPGTRPRRWMQRAMDAGGPQINAEFYAQLEKIVEAAAK